MSEKDESTKRTYGRGAEMLGGLKMSLCLRINFSEQNLLPIGLDFSLDYSHNPGLSPLCRDQICSLIFAGLKQRTNARHQRDGNKVMKFNNYWVAGSVLHG